jgi:hypothetical protein
MSAAIQMTGTRLAYVVVPQDGTCNRMYTLWDKKQKKIVRTLMEEPAGYLVYFPRGHVVRIKDLKTLRHYKLHNEAPLINLEGLQDPRTPLGKLMLSQDANARMHAMEELRQQVIQMTKAVAGEVVVAEDEELNEELMEN